MPHRVFYTMVRLTSYGIKNNLDNDSGLVGQVKAYMEGVFDMKKWFRPVRVIKKRIDISVNMDDYRIDDPVVKAAKPSNKKSKKISDDALSFYIGFLQYVILQVICNWGLKITKLYLSKKTCTYNIEVKHYGYIHDEKVKYIILFRVNNHINPTLNRGPKFNGGREMTMRERFPKPPMIVADRIGFVTGNGKAQQFPVHIPEQPPFCSHPSITSSY